MKQVDIKGGKSGGGIVFWFVEETKRKERKRRLSVKAWSVSSTMVKRAFAFTFTQHAGDCER